MTLHTVIDDEQEIIGDDIIRVSPLADISRELLEETIKTQIANPYLAVINCLEEFSESYDEEMDDFEEDPEMVEAIKNTATDFYLNVITLINDRFSLDIDFEVVGELDAESLSNLAEALYEFFIIKYSHNIAKCIIKMINNNFNQIIEYLSQNKNTNASIISYKKKMTTKESAIILSNINTAIGCVKTIELTSEDFMELFNEDKFEIAVIKYGIENNIINGDFVSSFLSPIIDRIQDDIYDEVVREVQSSLYQKFKKKEKFDVESIIKGEDGINETEDE